MVRTMPYIMRPINEIRKYPLVNVYTGDEEGPYDSRAEAVRAKTKKEQAGEFQWRVRVDVTNNHVVI